MNWDAVGAISEMTGVVAIVVTLLYFSAQIREQNKQPRDTTKQWGVEQMNTLYGLNLAFLGLVHEERWQEIQAVIGQGIGAVDQATGVYHDHVRILIGGGDVVAIHATPGGCPYQRAEQSPGSGTGSPGCGIQPRGYHRLGRPETGF